MANITHAMGQVLCESSASASTEFYCHWEVTPEATEQILEQQHVPCVACFTRLPLRVGPESFLRWLPTTCFSSFSSPLKFAW